MLLLSLFFKRLYLRIFRPKYCFLSVPISFLTSTMNNLVFIVARNVILIKKTVVLSGTGMLVCIVKYSCLFVGSQRLFEVRNLFPLSLLVKSPHQ